ncbi:uncharacterized protein E0L32_009303 [Thyridium curvatum]|uniref:Sphingoid long-chain base transporter RSB1 n=1 Tax=Thyridium curvatum TaxID=1093900 RepID=A0A507AZ97_9PEZI|nr:uncharacterized protein E0L32_009303 [Thyridium curvatum]TPX09560.1 hypothetical protein E0L32_009303 [Thyridium curvatum]
MSLSPASRLPPNVVVFGPQGNCTLDLCPVEYSVYGYRPSLAANSVLLVLFFLAMPVHAYLGVRWKTWWFMGCMIVGAANAITGYSGRLALYFNPFNFAAFMAQISMYAHPVDRPGQPRRGMAGAMLMNGYASINYLSPQLSRFRPEYFYYVFIPCDMVSLILQASGGALSVASKGSSQTGVDLALAGLSFQVVTIVAFCLFFADYLIRYFRSPEGQRARAGALGRRLALFFGFLGAAILIITARCVYRLVELHQGYAGELIKDEGLFIGMEGVTVVASVYFLMFGHPGYGLCGEWRKASSTTAGVEM